MPHVDYEDDIFVESESQSADQKPVFKPPPPPPVHEACALVETQICTSREQVRDVNKTLKTIGCIHFILLLLQLIIER